ncbi:MAG: capsule assembly Wzi family protein [Bacteroidota bacterium]
MAESLNNIMRCKLKRTVQLFALLLLFLIAACVYQVHAQSVYVPVQHEVYDFLKRMEARQLFTDYQDAAKPLSRMQIATVLHKLEQRADDMTRMERETFEFLKTEFHYEILKLSGDSEPDESRWHIYSHELSQGMLNLDIDYSLSQISAKDQSTNNHSQGLKMYGYMYNSVGFYFNFVDNLEKGDNINYSRFNDNQLDHFPGLSSTDIEYYKRVKTPSRGVILSQINGTNQVQYDEINAQFSWQIGSFTLSLEKMNNVWGYGRNGTVIFSDNAPSYPQIKLRVPISKDINFVYFHGELNSNVVDSSLSYLVTYPNQGYSTFREVDHSKYIAAHQLEISLWHGVDFSIGESIVYSDRGPLLMYLIPIMFFKAGEHYNGDKDNCQLFGSIDLNVVKNVNAYLSLFIDELNTDKLFDPNLSHRQVAFTSGIRVFDIPATNFDMTLEYTRVNPATYNHSYPSTTFTNNGFILGSWMGQNADDLFFEVGLSSVHALRLTTFGEIFRKGGMLSLSDQYTDNQGNWSFLFGPLHIERSVGITAKYQPLRDVFINLRARLHKIEDEANPAQNRPHQFEFTLGAGVGIW